MYSTSAWAATSPKAPGKHVTLPLPRDETSRDLSTQNLSELRGKVLLAGFFDGVRAALLSEPAIERANDAGHRAGLRRFLFDDPEL